MFRYHFLGHSLAELNVICCGSLLNSTEGNFFKHSEFVLFYKILNLTKFCVFFTQKMIKNVLCIKSKNASVRFFMCVQVLTAFDEAVLKLYVP